MKEVITAIVFQLEVTQLDEDGKVLGRPKLPSFTVFEKHIPDAVLEFARGALEQAKNQGG